MYIKSLKLENFRSAKDLELKLDKKINVFAGVNGVGKTTILDASAILLFELARKISENPTPSRFKNKDINNIAQTSSISMLLEENNEEYEIKLGIGKTTNNFLEYSVNLLKSIDKIILDITKNPLEINIPLFAYYPVDRTVNTTPIDVQNEYNFSILDAYENCLDNATSFKSFFQWFRVREDLENENSRRAKALILDEQLDFVRHALDIFMPQFTDIHIQRNPLRMVARKNDELVYINQLSDGEKCLFALIGDLARRLAIANPMRENPLDGEGIVLIDEIDLHLHPTWQQIIIPQLLKTFPNCQFIISTHSPHVLTHVEADKVFLVQNTKDGLEANHPIEMYGKTSESILKSFMGLETTRPKEIACRLHEIFTNIQERNLTIAHKNINSLEEEIGNDPELVKARALIKRMELIGK